MNRNIILGLVLLVFGVGFWYTYMAVYNAKPTIITDLEDDQTRQNEKLITSQILSDQLDRVYEIFSNNLAVNKDDVRFDMASMEFLNKLTDILDRLEIEIIRIKPKSISESRYYTETPYELEIECTFEEYGKFLAELESNDRLIEITEFAFHNGVERISTIRNADQLMNQVVEMEIATITLKKSSG